MFLSLRLLLSGVFVSILLAGSAQVGAGIGTESKLSLGNKLRLVVLDAVRLSPVAGASVMVDGQGFAADSKGWLVAEVTAADRHWIEVSATGCRPLSCSIAVSGRHLPDTVLLQPFSAQLATVRIHGFQMGQAGASLSQMGTTLGQKQLDRSSGGDLATVLSSVAGVGVLRTGGTIGKPVIDGLYGNRVLVISNDVRVEGQAWGMEHAPEIDPSSAARITVVNGADAVRYGAEAMGGVILVEPPPLSYADTSLHGEVHLNGVSNGRGGSGSLMVGSGVGGVPGLAWRLQGRYKQLGNYQAPQYFLENTAVLERNYTAALGYRDEHWQSELFFSQFETSLGIFLGAQVGSVADLYARIHSKGPYKKGGFSYKLQAPYQKVKHQVLKAKFSYHWAGGNRLELILNRQRNLRMEFARRRAARSTIPLTDLELVTNTLDLRWQKAFNSGDQLSVGAQLKGQSNFNDTITQANPVIPNYSNNGMGVYAVRQLKLGDRLSLEAGVRGDFQTFNAAGKRYLYLYYDDSGRVVPNELVPVYGGNLHLRGDYHYYGGDRDFASFSFLSGARWQMAEDWQLRANLALAWRTPNAQELYSYGLHQGVSSIEYGDSTLKIERGYKGVIGMLHRSERVRLQVGLFFQYLQNFIYLNPTGTFEQTVTGAYPVFRYLQSNAFYKGLNLDFAYDFNLLREKFTYQLQIAAVRAFDLSKDRYLPFVPPDNLQQNIEWHFNLPRKWPLGYLRLEHWLVRRQNRYEPGSDFLEPPPGYHVFGIAAGITRDAGHLGRSFSIGLSVENLLNRDYRDYMNRFRYYVAQRGRSVDLRLVYRF